MRFLQTCLFWLMLVLPFFGTGQVDSVKTNYVDSVMTIYTLTWASVVADTIPGAGIPKSTEPLNSWSLAGRGMAGFPKLDEAPKESGKVVLTIYVDRAGVMVRTQRQYAKSDKVSEYLFSLAESAAKKMRFTEKYDAPGQQKGEMTFNFKL